MSGLFDTLSMTARALQAQQFGLITTGQNIANLNTPGYTRREVILAEVAPTDDFSAGGVTVQGVRAIRDTFAEQRLWSEQPREQEQAAIADLLGVAQVAVGTPGQSLDADLGAFFDALAHLAEDPTSSTARQSVVLQGQALGASFSQTADQWATVQRDADQHVRSSVTDVSFYAAQIATLNASMGQVGGAATAQGQTIADELYEAVSALSRIVNISVISHPDGQLDVSYAGGQALVVGVNSYLPTVSTLPSGYAAVKAADGTDITSALTSGRLGGLVRVRDTVVPGYISQLDTLAHTLVQQVNTLHAGGYDLSGAPGGDFFSPIALVPGAAKVVSVNAAVAADLSKIAAAGSAVAGDNQTARALANLRDSAVVGGVSTLAEGWGNLAYQVGQDAQLAQRGQKLHADIVRQLQTLRDAASGVSIDEAAATMLRFQRAYEANARYFQTVNSALDTLLSLV